MLRTAAICVGSLCLLAGCHPTLLPDPMGAHKLADDVTVRLLVRSPDGTMRRQKAKLQAGTVCASQAAIDAALKE